MLHVCDYGGYVGVWNRKHYCAEVLERHLCLGESVHTPLLPNSNHVHRRNIRLSRLLYQKVVHIKTSRQKSRKRPCSLAISRHLASWQKVAQDERKSAAFGCASYLRFPGFDAHVYRFDDGTRFSLPNDARNYYSNHRPFVHHFPWQETV